MNNEIRQTYSDVWAQSCKSFYRYRLGNNPTIYKVQDGIFMEIDDRERVSEETVENYDYDELSEWEWSRSEFLIGSYFDGITYEQSLRLAFDIVELWGYKFHALFPDEEFHIILIVGTIGDTDEKTVMEEYLLLLQLYFFHVL